MLFHSNLYFHSKLHHKIFFIPQTTKEKIFIKIQPIDILKYVFKQHNVKDSICILYINVLKKTCGAKIF